MIFVIKPVKILVRKTQKSKVCQQCIPPISSLAITWQTEDITAQKKIRYSPGQQVRCPLNKILCCVFTFFTMTK